MAGKPKKKQNEKIAQSIANKTLRIIKRVLFLVGKPLYITLSYSLIGLLVIVYFIGHFTRILLVQFEKFAISLFKKASSVTFKTPKNSFKKKAKKRGRPKKIHGEKKIILPIAYRIKSLLTTVAPYFSGIKIKRPKLRLGFKFLLILLFLVGVVLGIFAAKILSGLPSPKELTTRNQEISTKIYDRNGVLLYKIFKDENRTPVSISEIPLHVRLATLAAEDAEFYTHPGFSVRGIARAITKNINSGQLSGGSTITQQLVKNALLSSEKTIVRKIREVILSVGVELTFTKDEILEMYLNEVAYGGTAYGIEEAAQVYFGKDVDELTLGESALLAGLPKSPSKYSPYGANPELAIARQKEVLNLMVINRYITREQASEAENQSLTFVPKRIDIKAPHFVMYIRQLLAEKYGEEVVEKGGLEVNTTLDYQIQQLAEEVVAQEISKLEKLNVKNAAVVILDPTTGEILAMVGSKDYFDSQNDGNVNVTLRPRQPGSSIKLINYAYALSTTYTPASILEDSPITFSIPGQPPYTPKNYEGNFRGKIPLRNALAESRNIPAVRVLASYGVDKMIDMGKKMGITTWEDSSRYGLSLTLGGGEVKLLDLAQAYATVANYGKRPEINSLLSVINAKGIMLQNGCEEKLEDTKIVQGALAAVLEDGKCAQEQVIDPRVSYMLIDILRDNQARSPSFGSNSQLVIQKHSEVAVKTGTSNDLRDNLTIGFNQKYLVAVWVGNNDNSPMARIASGVTGAAPIWNKIMTALLAKEGNHDWVVPNGLVQLSICNLTGSLSCKGCSSKPEWFLEENAPQKACSEYQLKKIEEEIKRNKEKEGDILDSGAFNERE